MYSGGSCIFVKSSVGNNHYDWLVDTGASVSLIHVNVFDEIAAGTKLPLTTCEVSCIAADGKTQMDVRSPTTVDVVMECHILDSGALTSTHQKENWCPINMCLKDL